MEPLKDGDFSKYVEQLLKEQSDNLKSRNNNELNKIIAENKNNSLEQTKEKLKNKDEQLAKQTAEFIEKINAGSHNTNEDLSSILQSTKNTNTNVKQNLFANTAKQSPKIVKKDNRAILTLIKIIVLVYILVVFFLNFWLKDGIISDYFPLFIVPAVFLVMWASTLNKHQNKNNNRKNNNTRRQK